MAEATTGYKVGDTVYRFPASYSPDRVQQILMQQGVIRVPGTDKTGLPGIQMPVNPEFSRDLRESRVFGDRPPEQGFWGSVGSAINPFPGITEHPWEAIKRGLTPPVLKGSVPGEGEFALMSPALGAGGQFQQGNVSGGIGTLAGGYGVPAALGAIGGTPRGRATVSGAAKGGWESLTPPKSTRLSDLTVGDAMGLIPAGLGGLAGESLAEAMGGTPAVRVAAGTVGAAIPRVVAGTVKGAVKGYKGYKGYIPPVEHPTPGWVGAPAPIIEPPPDLAPIPATATLTGRLPGPVTPATIPPRPAPAWTGFDTAPPPAPDLAPIPATSLPSGRVPGPRGESTIPPVVPEAHGASQPPAQGIPGAPPIGSSVVPPNAATFKHAAAHTDLIRQAHATAAEFGLKHADLTKAAKDVYGVDSYGKLSYEQKMAIQEHLLNNRKLPSSPLDLLPK